ncbi:MAG: transposase [Lachnospiraceae bacterium]|nr:transposase [Lachnospiraceae bacterium]
MVLNALDAETGLVLAQIPIQEKTNEITAIPQILKLFSLRGSTITTDSIGTQTEIMLQIREQGGHFVLLVTLRQMGHEEEKRPQQEKCASASVQQKRRV